MIEIVVIREQENAEFGTLKFKLIQPHKNFGIHHFKYEFLNQIYVQAC